VIIIYKLSIMEFDKIYNLEAKNHGGKINKKLRKFKRSNFLTDLHLVCQDGTVSVHKILFLQKMKNFSQLLCSLCDQHSETFIILPDITKQDLEKEIKSIYSFGNASGLEELFWMSKTENEKSSTKQNYINTAVEESVENISQVADNDSMKKEIVGAKHVLGDLVKSEDSEIKVESELTNELNELKLQSFKLLPGRTDKSTNSPGILIVDGRFKYFYKSEWRGKFTYSCAENRAKKCQAKALVQRDENTGYFGVVRCATDKVHNHDPSENKANKIVKKMRKEMTEMILADESLTMEDSLAAAKKKFSVDTEGQLWEDVLTQFEDPIKVRSFQRSLCRSKKRALGLTDSLVTHMKQVRGSC